jgi:RHS repeat-associated protein
LLTESNTGYSATYTYDYNGNRASQVLNGTTYSYSYDNGDKLSTITSGGTTVKSYTYDGAGRTHAVTTSAGTTTLNYDYEDRVTGITYPTLVTDSFTYNGLDTRVSKTDSTGTSTYKRDGADVTDPVLSDGMISYTPSSSERVGGVSTFNHPDYIGTISRQTNSSQITVATRAYDAFGNLKAGSGSPVGALGYVGAERYEEDPSSGLKLLGHRYYDPSQGRFLSRDPAGDGRNWYVYCDNSPATSVDPLGFAPGKKYRTPDAAAKAALHDNENRSVIEKKERGGYILRLDGGGFTYSDLSSTSQRTKGSFRRPPPPDSAVGGWHTHAAHKGDPEDPQAPIYVYDPDVPSNGDIITSESDGFPEYFASPTTIYKYSPYKKKTIPIGKM